jgi:hypothetical protein
MRIRLSAAGVLATLVIPLTATAAPPTPRFGPAIEPYAVYDPQRTCDPTAKPGPIHLRDLLDQTYGHHLSGIARACNVGGTSEHKEGRALDYHFNVNNAEDAAEAQDFLNWLLSADQYGNAHAMARRLGIMYVIWNRRIWESYRPHLGWQPYSGSSPHTDHIHFSFSWPGAWAQTSWWTGRVNGEADVTGDGRADIVGTTDGRLRGYRGDGSGNFHPLFDGGTGWDSLADLDLGDFNGDGRADIVGRTNGLLRVYRGDGTGNFHPHAEGGTGWDTVRHLNLVDVDGDARADIVGETGGRLRVYRGDGTGNFHPWIDAGTGWDSLAKLEAGDFNGDGKADIVGVTGGTLRVYRGDGTGNFHSHMEGGTGWDSLARMTVADFNGDGLADILGVTGGQLRVYRGDGTGNFHTHAEGGTGWDSLVQFAA